VAPTVPLMQQLLQSPQEVRRYHTSFKYQAGSMQRLQNDWNGV
jgi:hypothetical protein